MVCLALELVGPSIVLGFSLGMEVFDELLSINVPWIQDSLMFSGFGLKPPDSGFQFYFLQYPQDFSMYTALMIKHLGYR